MKKFRKKVYAAAGYNTTFMGPGRKEFHPKKPMRSFDEYIRETADGTAQQLKTTDFDEGVISNFMAPRFIKQANLPGFLPFAIPSLEGKPCTATEGACGSGGRALSIATRSILSDLADSVFVCGFEIQHSMKAVYGADVLAGAAYYNKERKGGHAHFFPGIFSQRAGAYFDAFDSLTSRKAMARWYEYSIESARKNSKAQEHHNQTKDLLSLGMTDPNPEAFIPHLNYFDCSKVSDGASSLGIFSEEGLKKFGIPKEEAIEIVSLAGCEGNITKSPEDLTSLKQTGLAGKKALEQAGIQIQDLGVLEIHDCFTITALLAIEALGLADKGKGAHFILDNKMCDQIPINLSGGLGGFGHPVGASGIRQLNDLIHQLTGKSENPSPNNKPYGMMVSMGGNDITVTSIIAKKAE